MATLAVEVRGVQVLYGQRLALDVPELAVRQGETLGVIGPNGCGKSTLLRVLALLQRPQAGEVYFAGERLDLGRGLLHQRRRLAIVFQEALLLDTSVYDNVVMGLRFRGADEAEARKRANFWLARLGVGGLERRRAKTLSGGEAQRVSLARSLVLQPELLLLDEPFSALDAPSRAALIDDLGPILREAAVTTVLVTHDRGEAIALSERLAVLIDGTVRQLGTPEEVFSAPASEEVATFVGVETIIPGRVATQVAGLATIETRAGRLETICDWPEHQSVLVLVRPEDVTLAPLNGPRKQTSARNVLQGTVSRVVSYGPLARVVVDCGIPIVALITHQSRLELGFAPGLAVTASFKATAVHVIKRE
ncbi:MAG: ABC transporter ATP-binding protein [Chloroflexi bacterium]|nr:ABC transporter ATP-binding protein [Chloroflexota bacterium]